MSQPRPRKRTQPRAVAKGTPPTARAPTTEAPPGACELESIEGDKHGYLAIGLAAGALAVVVVLVVLIAMAAN